jgi:23S rRNA (adenine2503-C2)-methyltransferase
MLLHSAFLGRLPLMTLSTIEPLELPAPKPALIGKTMDELKALVKEMGHPAFRGEQLHQWLYVHCKRDFAEMNNLSKSFRAELAERFQVGVLELVSRQVSKDGTRKYLFKLPDGEVIESVLMHYEDRDSYAICLSSQVGCAMNCSFCATGKLGLTRHMTSAEIVDQYVFVQHDTGAEIRNVVFMGQGEPLHNYDETVKAIRILNNSAEVGMRRMTVSTSGLVDAIDRLGTEIFPITLALSLHAPDNETRNQIMPLNKKYPLEKLIPALHRYLDHTGRRLTMEYIMIDGLNDTPQHAHNLGRLLHGLKANVNLIPYNPISKELPNLPNYKRSRREAIELFQRIVQEQYFKKVTVRVERGADIDAACGQLANRYNQSKETFEQPSVNLPFAMV